MVRYFIIRHGETFGTEKKQYHGSLDVSLTKAGKKQARGLQQFFAKEKINYIYSSPLQRCQQTARIIQGKRRVPFIVAPQLREVDFGRWEGLTLKKMHRKDPKLLKEWFADFYNFKMPDGEKVADMAKRAKRFWRQLVKKHKKGNVVVVSHGGPSKIILLDVLGLTDAGFWKFRLNTASVSIVECSHGDKLVRAINYRPGKGYVWKKKIR